MNVLAVVAHPDGESLTRTLLAAALEECRSAGADVVVDDLYEIGFDPVMRSSDRAAVLGTGVPDEAVLAEQAKIRAADLILIFHPVWWFYGPAMLKGWFDRVFTSGFAFRSGAGGTVGLLSGKQALVVQAAGQPADWYALQGADQYPHTGIGVGTLEFCGVDAQVLTHGPTFALTDADVARFVAVTRTAVRELLEPGAAA